MRWTAAPGLLGAAVLAAVAGGGCYNFHLQGPEEAPLVQPPRVVSVTIEYRQPEGCVNDAARCSDNVVFFGSWMRPGAQFFLTPDLTSHVYRGVALGVPVNFPPRDAPYLVRVFDPYLVDTEAEGITAQRLKVGGESLRKFDQAGTSRESGLVYIDESGAGHNPF